MVGFNLLNPSAREHVLQPAIERGAIPSDGIDLDDPLGFLIAQDCASGVVEAGYRFCSHEPGAHVILSGTGKIAHLSFFEDLFRKYRIR